MPKLRAVPTLSILIPAVAVMIWSGAQAISKNALVEPAAKLSKTISLEENDPRRDNTMVAEFTPTVVVEGRNLIVEGPVNIWQGTAYQDKRTPLRARVVIYDPSDRARAGEPLFVWYSDVFPFEMGQVFEDNAWYIQALPPNADPYPVQVGLVTKGELFELDARYGLRTYFIDVK